MSKFIVRTIVLILTVVVVFVGLMMASAVLGWMEWDNVWDVSGKVVAVSAIILLIVLVITGMTSILPKTNAEEKGKQKK